MGFVIVVVTIVFGLLYVSLPDTSEAVDTGYHRRAVTFGREPKFLGKQVKQWPLLLGTWLAIVVPLAGWTIVVARRRSRES